MRTRVAIKAFLLAAFIAATAVYAASQEPEPAEFGPEVRAFLDLMKQEEAELEYQITHNEISRRVYLRARNRIAIHRQAVVSRAKESGVDLVPELHVVTAEEMGHLIENGQQMLRRIKRGDLINEKWRYLGSVTRGVAFHIFERITPQ
jgi:hypothetical protein